MGIGGAYMAGGSTGEENPQIIFQPTYYPDRKNYWRKKFGVKKGFVKFPGAKNSRTEKTNPQNPF